MAQLEVRTNFCHFQADHRRSGVLPACSCGWTAKVTYGTVEEAEETWATFHKPTQANDHDARQDGIFVTLLEPVEYHPDAPIMDPPGPWNVTPAPPSNPAVRRGEEGRMLWR
jgi:hypothetical protein